MSYLKSASSNLVTCKVSSTNQHPRICVTINFHWKNEKNKNLGLKKRFMDLWARMLKNYCQICNRRHSICLIAKFRAKIKILKFGTKIVSFGCRRSQFQKTIVIFWISAPEFALLQSLVQKIKILKFETKKA